MILDSTIRAALLNLRRKPAAALLVLLAGAAAAALALRPAQNQPSPAASSAARTTIVLDPAHGGTDTGAHLPGNVLEKNVTLALALRLRAALQSEGFTVILTRDTDPPAPLTPDQRAEVANRFHAAACIVLHATAAGSGVHIYTSTLQPIPPDPIHEPHPAFLPTPWDEAQTPFIPRSRQLLDTLATAFHTDNLPVLFGAAPLRPLYNLLCPAVAIEIAPLPAGSGNPIPVTDPAYQTRFINDLAHALEPLHNQPSR